MITGIFDSRANHVCGLLLFTNAIVIQQVDRIIFYSLSISKKLHLDVRQTLTGSIYMYYVASKSPGK